MGVVELQLPDWREQCRYGVYTVRRCTGCTGSGMVAPPDGSGLALCGTCNGRGRVLVLLATGDTYAEVGQALCTQGDDCRDAGVAAEAYGVLDGHEGRWLAQPPWGAR